MRPKPGQYERYRTIFRNRRMPLAFVDLDNFDRNIEYVAGAIKNSGKTIRVHTKSVRCAPLLKRIMERGGPIYSGIMSFTMEETEFLAAKGFNDFIVAYPTVQPSDMKIFTNLTRAGKKVSLMIDSVEHLKILSRAGEKSGVVLNACLEIDTAYRPLNSPLFLGIRRSPVRTTEDALTIARASLDCRGVKINAVMGYEGHIAGPNDNIPDHWLSNRLLRYLKKRSIDEFTPRRIGIAEMFKKEGIELEVVNGGGSGSIMSTSKDPSVTEITAGSAFYAAGLFWHYREVDFTPSAFFAIQVVRKPRKGMVTCLGGGYTASGSAGADKLPVPVYPEGMKLLPLEGAGEVQTPLVLPRGCPELNPGDPVFFQHAKAGEITERFNELHLLEGDRITRSVKTYRGEGKAFL